MAGLTEEQIIAVLAGSQQEWDQAHGNGFDYAYLKLMPTLYHLQAHRIREAIEASG